MRLAMTMLLACLVGAVLSASPASAMTIDSVSVTKLGTPACYQPVPLPNGVAGRFYGQLPTLVGSTYGSVDPWRQWPLAKFRAATYAALFASGDAPSFVAYVMPSPQSSLSVVLGVPNSYNRILFKDNTGTVVAEVKGYDLYLAFGETTGLNLTFTMPTGVTFGKVVFLTEGSGTDEYASMMSFANVNAVCSGGGRR